MAYHHALACIPSPKVYIINRRLYYFRNDDMQCFALMIYTPLGVIKSARVQIHRLKR